MQIVDGLPLITSGLDGLQLIATEEGINNVSRLIKEWNLAQTLFDGVGECLFIAQINGMSIGVGGILKCKVVPDALRVSRFYVHPEWRRQGIARAIAKAGLSHAWNFTEVVTCNAQASSIASPFWESVGFEPVNIQGITHILKVSEIQEAPY